VRVEKMCFRKQVTVFFLSAPLCLGLREFFFLCRAYQLISEDVVLGSRRMLWRWWMNRRSAIWMFSNLQTSLVQNFQLDDFGSKNCLSPRFGVIGSSRSLAAFKYL